MSTSGRLGVVDANANAVIGLSQDGDVGWIQDGTALWRSGFCRQGHPLVPQAIAYDPLRALFWIYALQPDFVAAWDGEGQPPLKTACILPLGVTGPIQEGARAGVGSAPSSSPIDIAAHWDLGGRRQFLEVADGWGLFGLSVSGRRINTPWSRIDSLQSTPGDILVPDRTRQTLMQWSNTAKTGELDLAPNTPLAPAVVSADEALLLLRAAPDGSGRARMARIGLEGTRMWVKEAWEADEPSPPEGEWPWALAASPAGYAFSTTDGNRFMIARYDAAGHRLPPLYGGRYREKLTFRQSERIDQRRISVDGANIANTILADAAGGEWQRLNPEDLRDPLPWSGEMLIDVAVGVGDGRDRADAPLYRLVRNPDRLECWSSAGKAPTWTVDLQLSDEARVAAADWGAVVGLPAERSLRFLAAADGASLGQAALAPGSALTDVAALPSGPSYPGGAALSLDASAGILQTWTPDGAPGATHRVGESGSPLRVSARVMRADDSFGQAAVLTSDGYVEIHDLARGYLGRFRPIAPNGVLTQTTDLALLADGGLLLAEAVGSAVHHFAPSDAPTSTSTHTPAVSSTPSASLRPTSSPWFTASPSPTPRPTSLNPSRTPTVTPTATPSPSPTPIPTCIVIGNKLAAPGRLVLGQTAAVTLSLRTTCVGRPHPGGADIVVALDRSASMADDNFRRARRDLHLLATALDSLDYRLGLASFAADARSEFRLGPPDRQPLGDLDSLKPEGYTNITAGLESAAALLTDAQPDALRILLLLSDGRHSPGFAPPEPAAARLAAEGIVLLALAYGSEPDLSRLGILVGGQDLVWPASAGLDLAEIVDRIRDFTEDSLAGGLTVDDLLGAQMALVEGSVAPAAIQGPGRLLWSRPLMPRDGMILSYRVRPLTTGRLPVNQEAMARFTDADGAPGIFRFPVPQVEVIAPSPTPTTRLTPTPEPRPIFLPLLLAEPPCRPQARPLDVVLVLDVSSSMTGPKLVAAQAAARAFAAALSPAKDRLAIVAFHQEAHLSAPLSASATQLEAAITALQTAPGTRMDRGIATALAELLAAGRPAPAVPAIVLLTDGRQDQDPDAAVRAAASARAGGIQLLAVGFGADADILFLAQLSADPTNVHRADDQAALVDLYRRLATELPCADAHGWAGR